MFVCFFSCCDDLTWEQHQADQQPHKGLKADAHGQGQSLYPPAGTVAGGMAAAHADGQSAGAGERRSAAVHHHHRQQVLAAVLAGESAPARNDAGRIVYRAKESREGKEKKITETASAAGAVEVGGGFEVE